MVQLASLQCVIEAIPDHNHFLFLYLQVDKIIQGDLFSGKNSLKRPYASWKNIRHKSEGR